MPSISISGAIRHGSWDAGFSYNARDIVLGPDGSLYSALLPGANRNPVESPAAWRRLQTAATFLVADGDNLTANDGPTGTTNWFNLLGRQFGAGAMELRNFAKTGKTLAQVDAAYATAGAVPALLVGGGRQFAPAATGSPAAIYFVLAGSHDLAAGTQASALYGTLQSVVSKARADGYQRVVVFTLPARTGSGWGAGPEAQRLAFNTLVQANTAAATDVVDLAAALADPAAGSYLDGLHFTAAAQRRLAVLVAARLSGALPPPKVYENEAALNAGAAEYPGQLQLTADGNVFSLGRPGASGQARAGVINTNEYVGFRYDLFVDGHLRRNGGNVLLRGADPLLPANTLGTPASPWGGLHTTGVNGQTLTPGTGTLTLGSNTLIVPASGTLRADLYAPVLNVERRFEINTPFGARRAPVNVYTDAAATTPALTAGTVVKAWKDPGSGYTFTQSTTAAAPTLEIYEGRWVLRFTTAKWMGMSNASLPLPNLDVWLRCRVPSTSTDGETRLLNGAGTGEYSFLSPNAFFLYTQHFYAPLNAMRTLRAQKRTADSFFTNGTPVNSGSALLGSSLTGTSTRLYLNVAANNDGNPYGTPYANMDVEAVLISHATTDADATEVDRYLTPEHATTRVVFDGDSLTQGTFGNNPGGVLLGNEYPAWFQAWNRDRVVYNLGLWGSRIADGSNRTARAIAAGTPASTYVLLIGRNDLAAGVSASALLAAVQAHCQAVAPSYARVYVGTIFAEATGSGGTAPSWESVRLAYNSALKAGHRAFANGVIDFAADPRLQDGNNATYFYSDKLHQTAAGHRAKAENADIALRQGSGIAPLFP